MGMRLSPRFPRLALAAAAASVCWRLALAEKAELHRLAIACSSRPAWPRPRLGTTCSLPIRMRTCDTTAGRLWRPGCRVKRAFAIACRRGRLDTSSSSAIGRCLYVQPRRMRRRKASLRRQHVAVTRLMKTSSRVTNVCLLIPTHRSRWEVLPVRCCTFLRRVERIRRGCLSRFAGIRQSPSLMLKRRRHRCVFVATAIHPRAGLLRWAHPKFRPFAKTHGRSENLRTTPLICLQSLRASRSIQVLASCSSVTWGAVPRRLTSAGVRPVVGFHTWPA